MRAVPVPQLMIPALLAFIAAVVMLSQPASAQAVYQEGKDYAVLPNPVRTTDPSKIEVAEVFWYGCPHCNTFRPLFEQWKKQSGDDITVQHTPAMWSKSMAVHAQIFYTAKVLGKLDVMHKEIFDAMHVGKKKLLAEKQIYTLFEKHGVDKSTFDKTFSSFGVNSQVQQAASRARGYQITSTPTVVVNGKYRVLMNRGDSFDKVMKVADYLVNKERAALKAKRS